MDGTEINNVRDLIKVLNKHKVGEIVTMEFFKARDGETQYVLNKAHLRSRGPRFTINFTGCVNYLEEFYENFVPIRKIMGIP